MRQENISIIKTLVFALIIALLSVSLSACNGSDYTGTVTNTDVINFQDFYLDAAGVGLATQASGTVFVRGDLEKPDDIFVEVSMYVNIDPDDWGGVSLYFPEGWRVNNVLGSVVEIDEPYYSNLVSAMSSGQPEDGAESWVSVGYPLTQAGDSPGDLSGSVVIQADYVWKGKTTPEILDLTIGVGSKDGYIVNPVLLDLEVPLLEDFRPVRVAYYFPRQKQPLETGEMTHSRQIQGELVIEEGFLRVDGYLVIWPYEYFGWSDTETVWVKDGESGASLASIGDVLTIPGYEVGAQEAGAACGGETFLKGFPGPYWLGYSIHNSKQ